MESALPYIVILCTVLLVLLLYCPFLYEIYQMGKRINGKSGEDEILAQMKAEALAAKGLKQ